MRTIIRTKKSLDFKEYVKRSALVSDFSELFTEDVLITDEQGNILILYYQLPPEVDTTPLLASLKRIKYSETKRTGGLKTTSAIFGYAPRNVLRKDFCSATSMARDFSQDHLNICNFGKELSRIYEKFIPKKYAEHLTETKNKVKKEWVIEETPFTSGIVNKNNPLKYHFDTGNFKGVYSNMIVFKDGVEGGYLSCPEYDFGFELRDRTVLMFDGQGILHGVTPIIHNGKGYRYSVVYYTLLQWKCQTVTEELARIRKLKTERENKRAGNALKSSPKI